MPRSRAGKIAAVVVIAILALMLLSFFLFNIGGSVPDTGTGEILTSTSP